MSWIVRVVGLLLIILGVQQLTSPLRSFDQNFERHRRVFLAVLALIGLYLLVVGDVRTLLPW